MQEHIRRAHPEHYISKLPATEESFALMISSPPSERPRESTSQGITTTGEALSEAFWSSWSDPSEAIYGHDKNSFQGDGSSPLPSKNADDYTPGTLLPAANAAAALAQLHTHRVDSDWESETDNMSDHEIRRSGITSTIELPGIAHVKHDGGIPFASYDPTKPRQLLPSILSRSPPGRSSTLPPIQRRDKPNNRPRKTSITQNARKAQHERKRSKGEHARRMSYDGRKAYSAEPPPSASHVMGKRWEDLIDAATTATEADDEDRTPIPQSPPSSHRASLPPFPTAHFQSYQASPLQHAITPPTHALEPEPFPSVESGENFHIESRGLESSSPAGILGSQAALGPAAASASASASAATAASSNVVQIYCAACQTATALRTAYACTECICGICRECVDVLVAEQGARRRCPRCGTVGGRFRPFQLDLR
ncbi:MAG: hypothetical protein M1825_001760 [Sarcosagium campestre]|nr:MAG: hypothetical protein M1825_001760 [Sarcosagium campestre]